MKRILAVGLVALLAGACQGNPVAPRTPPPSAPATPEPTPLPAAPKAVLSIGDGNLNPPLAILNFTRVLFDGSRSEGDGLMYLLEFGDGASSTDASARYRPEPPPREWSGGDRLLTARLTVADKYGRSDSITKEYRLASVHNASGTHWGNVLETNPRRPIGRSFVLAQDGTTLSGWYAGPERGRNRRVTGTLSGDRAIHLRVDNGEIEFTGTVNWHRDHDTVVLRLLVRGGLADGSVLDFHFSDPY